MNSEIKAQWVAALRSGEYAQGNGRLAFVNTEYDSDTEIGPPQYCCLGVLCELGVKANPGVIEKIARRVTRTLKQFHYGTHGAHWWLPSEILEWAGLTDDRPVVDGSTLDRWNDSGTPFTIIADKIEASDL